MLSIESYNKTNTSINAACYIAAYNVLPFADKYQMKFLSQGRSSIFFSIY